MGLLFSLLIRLVLGLGDGVWGLAVCSLSRSLDMRIGYSLKMHGTNKQTNRGERISVKGRIGTGIGREEKRSKQQENRTEQNTITQRNETT